MKKRLLGVILAATMCLLCGAVACAGEETAKKHTLTSAEYPLYIGTVDLNMPLKLYFCDGVTDLPYMEVNDWLPLMSHTVGSSSKGVSFTIAADGPVVTLTRQNEKEDAADHGVPMTIDFQTDTMEFQDYNLFCMRAGSSTIMDTVNMPVFNDAGEPTLLQKVDAPTPTMWPVRSRPPARSPCWDAPPAVAPAWYCPRWSSSMTARH